MEVGYKSNAWSNYRAVLWRGNLMQAVQSSNRDCRAPLAMTVPVYVDLNVIAIPTWMWVIRVMHGAITEPFCGVAISYKQRCRLSKIATLRSQ